jgi:uncharacterized membrane protein
MEVLNVVAIVGTGLMVGCELSIAAFIHPTLDTLPEEVHLPAASAIARVMGAAMPFWYALTLLLTVVEGAIHWHTTGHIPIWIVASAVFWMLVIVCTVTILVPINNRIASWEKSTPPADWKRYRNRWDLLHRWRVVVLAIAFVLLIVGIL